MSSKLLCPPPPPPLLLPTAPALCGKEGRQVENTKTLVRKNLLRIQENDAAGHDTSTAAVRHLVSALHRRSAANGSCPTQCSENPTKVFVSLYREVTPVVQDGPSCGLAALCMALNLLHGSNFCLQEVLAAARNLRFTNQGEMFSAANLLALATELIPGSTGYLLGKDTDEEKKASVIVEGLLRQGTVLVPYDKDGNHEPCLKRGQKAHWALLTGLVLHLEAPDIETLKADPDFAVDEVLPDLCHLKSNADDKMLNVKLCRQATYVYAFHGRSIHCRLWSLSDLLASNAQLLTLSAEIEASLGSYLIPEGGIEAGLCGQVLVLPAKHPF